MDFRGGREWCDDLKRVWKDRSGIEQWVGVPLKVLTLISPPTWVIILFNRKDRWITDLYVVLVLVFSVVTYLFAPHCWCAWISTYFSASTVIVLLNVVLLSRVFGPPFSPERSLLLFICNAAQITFMFAIWYYLYRVPDPLIKSILTFATIGYAAEMKPVAMVQIATDFVLLAIYLSQLIGGPKNGMTRRSGQFRASMPPTIMRGRRAQALGLIRPNRAT
jgi:hypothetical protein